MKIVFLLLTFVVSKSYAEINCDKYKIDSYQKEYLKHSFSKGSSKGFGLTLAAIAFQESNLGRYLINWDDPSFGAHHILISTGSNIVHARNRYDKILLSQELITNPDLSADLALAILEYWEGRLKKKGKFSWRNLWGAYNAGNNYDSTIAQKYASHIADKVKWIKECGLSPFEIKYLRKTKYVWSLPFKKYQVDISSN